MAKKILCVIVFMLALVCALASCGGDDSDTTTATVTTTGNPAHTHNYGEWETVKNATCTEDGIKKKACSCGDTEQEKIPRGHNYVNGKCSVCSRYDIADVTIFYVYDVYDANTDAYNLYVSFWDSNGNRIAADFTGSVSIIDNFNGVVYEQAITATEAEYNIYPTQHSGDVLAHKITIGKSAIDYASTELGKLYYTVNYQEGGKKESYSAVTNLPVAPFEPITYSGSGDKTISNINLPAGSFSITLAHNGKSNFITELYYGDKSYNYQLLTNEIGKYEGTHAFYKNDGKPLENGILQVEADGYWTITIERVSGACTTNIKGHGDTVTGLIKATEAREVITLRHSGKSNFIVGIYDKTEGKCNYTTLTNEIGNYSGEKVVTLTAGHEYFFYVRADGDWTIDFGRNDQLTDYTQANSGGGSSATTSSFTKLKNYVVSNGTYNSKDNNYKLDIYVDYSSDYKSQYTYYLTYDIAADKIIWNFYSYSTTTSSLVGIYINNEADGSYTWTYVDGNGYQMAGYLTATTFTSNTLLGYSTQNISNSTIRSNIRELASIGVRLVLLTVETQVGSKAGISITDFGFTSFLQ